MKGIKTMEITKSGVRFCEDDLPHTEVTVLCSDKDGTWLRISGAKQYVDLRVTPSGLVRMGKPYGVPRG